MHSTFVVSKSNKHLLNRFIKKRGETGSKKR